MKKLKPNEIRYVLYFMIIVFVVSSFSFINLSTNNGQDTVNAYLSIVGLGQDYYQEFSVPVGANLYYLLYNTGFVSFQSDYSIKCVGQTCNDYLSSNYWQIFLNNSNVGMDYLINGSEQFTLYYGKRINLINISLNLFTQNFAENTTLKIPDTMNLISLLNTYNASFTNGSLNCIFEICGNWTTLVNNETKAWNYTFNANDEILFELE
ncbi:MAG: hypothetical protein PHN56_02840 [Candidatus Nanoarchaeia archaeon]|nr:hypothetical protein [Candidatus Nanoarchaeia archaeon]